MNKRVFIAGHRGMLGSSLVRLLNSEIGFSVDVVDGDLRYLENYPKKNYDYSIICAAKVGGIVANTRYPADFLSTNALIQLNALEWGKLGHAGKLMLIGSSCIYPKNIGRAILPSDLLSGYLEETNKPYAIAKILGLVGAEAYRNQYGLDVITCMPCNLYGPGDNYTDRSHVMASLIKRSVDAGLEGLDYITVGGSGRPRREFLYVDDCAKAIMLLMDRYSGKDPVNIGAEYDLSIDDLTNIIIEESGYNLRVERDDSIPDGVFSKKLDCSVIRGLGWQQLVGIRDGIRMSMKDYSWRYHGIKV